MQRLFRQLGASFEWTINMAGAAPNALLYAYYTVRLW